VPAIEAENPPYADAGDESNDNGSTESGGPFGWLGLTSATAQCESHGAALPAILSFFDFCLSLGICLSGFEIPNEGFRIPSKVRKTNA
jgi:hypothetical protein